MTYNSNFYKNLDQFPARMSYCTVVLLRSCAYLCLSTLSGLLTSKKGPVINRQGQNTSHVYSTRQLHTCVGQDSLLHRKLNFKGRPDPRNRSINNKTSRRQKCSGRKVRERVRWGGLGKTPGGEDALLWPQFLCAYGKKVDCEWGMRKEMKHHHFQQAAPRLLHHPEVLIGQWRHRA